MRDNRPHPIKIGILRSYLPLMTFLDDFHARKELVHLIISTYIDDQKILQSDWMRDTTDLAQQK